VRNLLPEPLQTLEYVVCKEPKLVPALIKFERDYTVRDYKFGVLYCTANQTDEDDMFSNSEFLFFKLVSKLLFTDLLNFIN
jgi:hypothetical protein